MAQRFKLTTVAILLLAAILLGSLIIFLPTNFAKAAVDEEVYDAGLALFRHTVAPLSDENYTIYSKQEIEMFNGDMVSVYDLNPNGYFVYHSESDSLMEFALDTHSPFDLIEGDKYYLAPSYYIEKSNDEYKDLISSNVVARESVSELADISENAVTAIKEEKIAKQEEIRKSRAKSAVAPQAETATLTQIKHPEFFSTMSNCGYYCPENVDGICGYIASGMIFAYTDYYWTQADYFPDHFFESYEIPIALSTYMSKSLWDIGKAMGLSNGTNSADIKKLMDVLVQLYEIPNFEHTRYLIITKNRVKNLLKNDQPVMLGGILQDPDTGITDKEFAHWVVAYKLYEYTVDFYVVHYGWSGERYKQVYLSLTSDNYFNNLYSLKWS